MNTLTNKELLIQTGYGYFLLDLSLPLLHIDQNQND